MKMKKIVVNAKVKKLDVEYTQGEPVFSHYKMKRWYNLKDFIKALKRLKK